MKIFAVINSDIIENLVECEELEVLAALLPDADVIVEVTDETGVAFIGSEYDAEVNKFVPLKPFDSWSFDKSSWAWKAPKPYPTTIADGSVAYWDEATSEWVEFTPPTEEPSV